MQGKMLIPDSGFVELSAYVCRPHHLPLFSSSYFLSSKCRCRLSFLFYLQMRDKNINTEHVEHCSSDSCSIPMSWNVWSILAFLIRDKQYRKSRTIEMDVWPWKHGLKWLKRAFLCNKPFALQNSPLRVPFFLCISCVTLGGEGFENTNVMDKRLSVSKNRIIFE